jgi:hypothetical protein
MSFLMLIPPTVFECGVSYFAECVYGYCRYASANDFDFHEYLRKLLVIELSHFQEMRVHILCRVYQLS